jgi:equilibrative nucleoside transporter 1/2/3
MIFLFVLKYFNYKFRPLSIDNSTISNGTSFLQLSFVNVSNISANISTTILIILNTVYGYKIKINYRFYTTGLSIFILFIITTIFVKVNTDTWQYGFYILTILTIIFINGLYSLS